jgi:hypothetical protein
MPRTLTRRILPALLALSVASAVFIPVTVRPRSERARSGYRRAPRST